jgi:hypothetical protein
MPSLCYSNITSPQPNPLPFPPLPTPLQYPLLLQKEIYNIFPCPKLPPKSLPKTDRRLPKRGRTVGPGNDDSV